MASINKTLVVFTTEAWPPPPGKALEVQNCCKNQSQNCFSSLSDPGKRKIVGPNLPPVLLVTTKIKVQIYIFFYKEKI